MLKRFLLKFLYLEIEEIRDRARILGYDAGYEDAIKEREAERRRVKEITMNDNIGKKVIYTSNEWEDPSFAIIEGVEVIPNSIDGFMYRARDVLTNQTLYFFEGTLYLADEKMVDCILKLNPFERWNMNLAKGYLAPNMWEKCYPPQTELTDPVTLKQKLKEVYFI